MRETRKILALMGLNFVRKFHNIINMLQALKSPVTKVCSLVCFAQHFLIRFNNNVLYKTCPQLTLLRMLDI